MASVVREKEMNVPVRFFYEAVSRFENYPQFLNEVVNAVPGPVVDGKQKVKFELEIVKRFQYELEFNLVPEKEVSWKLVDSNFFKVNNGKWAMRKISDDKTHVSYEVEVGFGFFVPGWVTKKLTEVNLPKMFDSFEEQAKKLQAKG